MIDELYINGTRADMSSKSGVYLQYNSCLLSSLDSIDANHSYTIKLPKTATNLALIGGLMFPSSGSAFPSANNVATLLRDGIPLCQDATLYLMGITTDEIQVAISWGIGDKLDAINDKSIRETSWANDTELTWREISYQEFQFIQGYWGEKHSVGEYQHMGVKVADVMQGINEETGGLLDYDETRFNDFYVPILLRNPKSIDSSTADVVITKLDRDATGTSGTTNARWRITGEINNPNFSFSGLGQQDNFFVLTPSASHGGWKGYIQIYAKCLYGRQYDLEIHKGTSTGSNAEDPIRTLTPQLNSSGEYVVFTSGDGIDISEEGQIIISFYSTRIDQSLTEAFTDVDIRFIESADTEDLAVPLQTTQAEVTDLNILPLSKNLPEISCMDFVKAVCGLFGLFPCLVDDRVVLKPYDDLTDLSNAEDWSGYLCSIDDYPNQMDITDDSLGQKTWFKFNNDEDAPNASGFITISNNALEKEVDFMQVATCSPTDVSTDANIVLYTFDNEGEWEYEENEDCYILTTNINEGQTQEYFYALGFQSFLDRFWQNASSFLQGKVITEYFYLDSVVLKDIDMTKPIYLDKYGRYFALMEIKTKENDMAEVKLLTL